MSKVLGPTAALSDVFGADVEKVAEEPDGSVAPDVDALHEADNVRHHKLGVDAGPDEKLAPQEDLGAGNQVGVRGKLGRRRCRLVARRRIACDVLSSGIGGSGDCCPPLSALEGLRTLAYRP